MMTMAKVTICRYMVCGTAAAGCVTVASGAGDRVARCAVVARCRLRKTFFAPALSDGIRFALFDMLIPKRNSRTRQVFLRVGGIAERAVTKRSPEFQLYV